MNPFLGVFFHWLGGLASGSFYVPYRGVRKWAWEVYWLVGGVFSWIICPLLLASLLTSDVFGAIRQQSLGTLWWTYFFGAMWGFGGLTFGLTMRYLGMSLGMGVALGYCGAFAEPDRPGICRGGNLGIMDRVAQAGGGVGWRIHHQFHLVCDPQYPEQNRVPILQPHPDRSIAAA